RSDSSLAPEPLEDWYLSPNGHSLAVSRDFEIQINRASGSGPTSPVMLRGHTEHPRALAWSPDSRRLASGDEDGIVKVWDAANGQGLLTLRGPPGAAGLHALQFSPDGWRLAVAEGNTVRIRDARHSCPDIPDARLHVDVFPGCATLPERNQQFVVLLKNCTFSWAFFVLPVGLLYWAMRRRLRDWPFWLA